MRLAVQVRVYNVMLRIKPSAFNQLLRFPRSISVYPLFYLEPANLNSLVNHPGYKHQLAKQYLKHTRSSFPIFARCLQRVIVRQMRVDRQQAKEQHVDGAQYQYLLQLVSPCEHSQSDLTRKGASYSSAVQCSARCVCSRMQLKLIYIDPSTYLPIQLRVSPVSSQETG